MRKILVALTVFITTIILAGFVLIPEGEKSVLKKLKKQGLSPNHRKFSYNDTLHVNTVSFGNELGAKVFLIHGSPGDWSAWENIYLDSTLQSKYNLIGMDRAGFGETSVSTTPSLKDQSKVVWAAISRLLAKDEECIIIGHSYGGAVVEQLILDKPKSFSKAILVAPALSPTHQHIKWYNKFARSKIINWVLSESLKASNIEMIGLQSCLRENQSRLESISTPIVYIQGLKDMLVHPETVDYFKSYVTSSVEYIIIDDMNHFTPWSHPHLIIDAILSE